MNVLLALTALVGMEVVDQGTTGVGPSDPRLQTLVYDAGRIPQLRVAAGYALTLVLSPDEAVQTVAIGESNGWQVVPSRRGDTLFIKADASARPTNLSVITNTRTYSFDLAPVAQPSADVPYRLEMSYPQLSAGAPSAEGTTTSGSYRLEGSKALRPAAISDDGARTYIEWKPDQALPGVFTIDDAGREALVDGHMRQERYVIDAVLDRLIFRLDRQVARAIRTRENR